MLSDDEERRLQRLGRCLAADDPALARSLDRFERFSRERRRCAVGAAMFGAAGIPASVIAGDARLMLLALCVLWVAAGLWHPVR